MNSVIGSTIPTTSKGWNLGLWAGQVALAAIYGMAGYNHLVLSPEVLAQMGMSWATSAPEFLLRFIGLAELAGAVGVIIPAATRIMPWLTPIAALGLAAIQLLAMPLHIYRGELLVVPFNILILAIALFVFWGRSRKSPILSRI